MTESFVVLWCVHTDRDRDWEMMGSYITLCTVHTTHGQEPLFSIVSISFAAPVPCSVYEPLKSSCYLHDVTLLTTVAFCRSRIALEGSVLLTTPSYDPERRL